MKDRVITSRKISVPDQDGHCSDKIVEVLYDRHGDKFYVELPGFLQYKAEEKTVEIKGDTPQKALTNAEHVCSEYKGAVIKRRRVIIYQLFGQKRSDKGGEFDRNPGTGLRVHWHACWEFTVKPVQKSWGSPGETQYGATERCPSPLEGDWISPRDYDYDKQGWKVIPWTQQREDFFRSLEVGLVALVDRAQEIMGNRKRLVATIDARPTTRLLEGPK
jgi:hypothetical protein